MDMRNNRWTDLAAAAAFAVVLGASALWGQHNRAEEGPGQRAALQRNIADMGMEETSADPAESTGDEAEEETLLKAEESQEAVLKEIMGYMEKQDLESAAQAIDSGEEVLLALFYDVLGGERYLYDGQSFSPSIEGKGMVLTMPNTVYFGTFKDGKPEGECTVLQVVELDAPRYDYSQGMWKNGKMEGQGHTGYCYYKGGPEGEARDVCRTGTFSNGRMEGEVTYTTLNKEGEPSNWKFTVKDGTVLLDDKWSYIEENKEYQLMSEEDDSHAYILGEEAAGQPVWINLLAWEE